MSSPRRWYAKGELGAMTMTKRIDGNRLYRKYGQEMKINYCNSLLRETTRTISGAAEGCGWMTDQ